MTSDVLLRRSVALLAAAGLALSAAACSSGTSSGGDAGKAGSADAAAPLDPAAKVTVSIDCQPPVSKPAERKQWADDVAAFNKLYPNVTVASKDGFPCEEPAAFTAQLKGRTQTDVFYSYFTDLNQVLDANGAADISAYVNEKTVPALKDIDPSVLATLKADGKLYGLPTSNYKMGLLYNRKLFKQAGLDPEKPPTTWAEIREAAKKIAALGNGVNGYGDYSATNQGGWHYTAELYGLGGSMTTADGKKAAFNTAEGKQVLQNLYDLRWTDNAMGATQGLKWPDLMTRMATDKLGMYVGAPDDITYMVQTLKGNYDDYGMGPMPGGKSALLGGNDYIFKKGSTPDQIKAGIAWINFKYLTIGKGQFDYARTKGDGLPVGLPQPFFFTGAGLAADNRAKAASATVPVQNYAPYLAASVPGKTEPANAQQIYKVLDNAVSAVLTDRGANVDKLLADAESQVNQVLANLQ
ncbi:extracellular solute-binding protein [Kitasatospora paracochleata]|uniref:ABC-type glycerol-3-phosphate transport system substrate-binding protein n=1 Tax=Kitasatospora paracochleata TaxID=58354 RepID=A0ABT1IU72_9ACTN|nr:extracellular solute-binding protein [Kitasatospora paracochleata]MCP2308692.1 ABC-type glycerol-3-phosphate transport system substrate-binding protein [Kitasatospora paracochleata]